MVVNGVSNALSTFSSKKGEFSKAEIVEVGCSVDNSAEVVHGNRYSEGGSVVANNEAADTTEHGAHGGIGGHLVLVNLSSSVLVIDYIFSIDVLDAGVVGDVGDEKRVNLGR